MKVLFLKHILKDDWQFLTVDLGISQLYSVYQELV
jgi:hypothetical protein